jgi:hypothetical protein
MPYAGRLLHRKSLTLSELSELPERHAEITAIDRDEWSHPEFPSLGVQDVYTRGRIDSTPGALMMVLAVSNPECGLKT